MLLEEHMANANIIPETTPYLFEAPVPGQSLTNSPDAPYAWEQPPEITTQREAIDRMFLEIIKPENMETLAGMMSDEVPIANIAELLIKTSFQKGKINPDLAITLMEPTMYMLLSVAEKVGIDPILSEDEDLDESLDDDEEDQAIAQKNVQVARNLQTSNEVTPNPQKLRELPAKPRNIPMSSPELKAQLDNLDTSKVRESILQRKQPQANESLLGKTGV